jgi:hypothetical protein
MTFEEEQAIISEAKRSDGSPITITCSAYTDAWKSACARAKAAEELAELNDRQCRRWIVQYNIAQDELGAIKGALRLLRSFVSSL